MLKKIFQLAPPKRIQSKTITGRILADLLSIYIRQMNGDKEPNTLTAWAEVMANEATTSLQEAKQYINQKVHLIDCPLENSNIYYTMNDFKQDALANFEDQLKMATFKPERKDIEGKIKEIEAYVREKEMEIENKNRQKTLHMLERNDKAAFRELEKHGKKIAKKVRKPADGSADLDAINLHF